MDDKTAAYLTHELRAPLTSIRCALEYLRGEVKDPRSLEAAEIALRNAERLAGLIDDILETSRVQSGRLALSARPVDAGEAAREAVTALLPWADRKGVRLSVLRELALPAASADPKRLHQALTNLLSNALKFTPAGGRVTVEVRRGRRERAGRVVFCVRDTGPGIAPEDGERLFRYFAQGAAGKASGAGTGLGLALARAMAELMGGSLWFESEPGRGAAFFLALPAHIPALGSGGGAGRAPSRAEEGAGGPRDA
ncbi:MAG: HAMP domain-containing histidine kinase [Elusimicrobia bacterium]|nr:HAMP domain-containing histidine kinase [Elusimicrobiota bacterium]